MQPWTFEFERCEEWWVGWTSIDGCGSLAALAIGPVALTWEIEDDDAELSLGDALSAVADWLAPSLTLRRAGAGGLPSSPRLRPAAVALGASVGLALIVNVVLAAAGMPW